MPERGETWAEKLGTENWGKFSNGAMAANSNVGWFWEKLRAGAAGTGWDPGAGWAQQLICLQAQPAHLADNADAAVTTATLCVHTSRRLNRMANADFTRRI